MFHWNQGHLYWNFVSTELQFVQLLNQLFLAGFRLRPFSVREIPVIFAHVHLLHQKHAVSSLRWFQSFGPHSSPLDFLLRPFAFALRCYLGCIVRHPFVFAVLFLLRIRSRSWYATCGHHWLLVRAFCYDAHEVLQHKCCKWRQFLQNILSSSFSWCFFWQNAGLCNTASMSCSLKSFSASILCSLYMLIMLCPNIHSSHQKEQHWKQYKVWALCLSQFPHFTLDVLHSLIVNTSSKLLIRKLVGSSLGLPLPGISNCLLHSGHVIVPWTPLDRWISFRHCRQ